MKKILSLLYLLMAGSFAFSQSPIGWTTPLTVSSGNGNIYPRLTLVENDYPLVIWENSSTDKIYSSVWNGGSFSPALALNPAGLVPFVATWSGAELASSGDTVFVVFSSEPVMTGNVYAVRSVDGGLTFGDTIRVDQIGNDIPNFPTVAVTAGGNPVIAFMRQDSATMANPEYVISKSVNGGSSYLPTIFPAAGVPGMACDCCPPALAVSGNRLAMLYRNDISNVRDIWAAFSSDEGSTFPAAAEVDQSNWMIMSCPSSGPSGIISGDTLISVWMSEGTTGDPRIYVGTSNINDQQVGFNKQVYPFGSSTQNYPVIAGSGDTLGVVWQGYNMGLQDVLFSCSVTGAAGLGEHVDTLSKGGSGAQTRPDLAYKNGKFHVVYSGSFGTKVEYMSGTFGGSTGIEKPNPQASSLNAAYGNGSMQLQIRSGEAYPASCRVMNTLGQIIAEENIQIQSGDNTFSIPGNYSRGAYFIQVLGKGRLSQAKVMVAAP